MVVRIRKIPALFNAADRFAVQPVVVASDRILQHPKLAKNFEVSEFFVTLALSNLHKHIIKI